MKFEVRLFAVARQLVGAERVAVDVPEPTTVATLRAALARDYPALAPLLPHMLVAVGNDYAGNEIVLDPRVEVACIPPVSGG